MKILVGSKNPVKIEATQEAFEKFFSDIEIIGISVPSNVADQPVNKETFDGAENRANELKRINNDENLEAEFFVGIEGGIIETYGNWFGLGCMCILDKFGNNSFGTSPHFPLPKQMVDEMLNGKELGHIMDESTGDNNTKQKQGAIGIFTNGVMSRKELYVSGLISAIIPFINKETFGILK